MVANHRRSLGFTVIELMVTIAVVLVLAVIAFPSFQAMRQRSAIRGAGEQLLSFWNQARFEAVKRNSMVKVGVIQTGTGAKFCLGARATTNSLDTTPCDCTQAAPSDASLTCDVARYPADMADAQSEWNRVTLAGMTLGGGTNLSNIQPAVMEPKRTALTVSGDAGTVTLLGPPGRLSYKLNLNVDKFGRAVLCESRTSPAHLSDFTNRICIP